MVDRRTLESPTGLRADGGGSEVGSPATPPPLALPPRPLAYVGRTAAATSS
jgi:hypothetical protein